MSKLKEFWNQAVKFSLGKGKLDAKERFSVKLDKLFDILTCKCQITSCEGGGCDGCVIQAHINCSCSREKRIPLKDLAYTKGQKEKVGSKGSHQIGGPDLQEHKRQADGDEDLELESVAEDEFVPEVELFPETEPEPAASTKVQKNYALASVRYGIGLRPTAAIATAALIDAGIITEDNTSKVIDKNKVKRAQEKLMRELGEEFEEKCREMGGISCILFDGRIDLANVMMEAEGSDQSFPAKIREHYYPCWFNVKVKHSWIKGPRHIQFQLDCLKSQRKEVLDLVRRSAWYAHSEAILQTLLCSEDQKERIEERIEGVERILAIRGEGDPDTQLGDSSVRTRRTPDINCDASSIGDLISWSEGVSEPPLTCLLSTSEVKNVIKTPMEIEVFE
ncbi:3-deoxy-D-manno-octulosonic acid kinase [Dissostichus eleginoides]|uniref:3-deoxy-D-manno-octulosonic acid kinase n=1 Tax=Dissostichus eleginoides TaxID=100907 RepID=A0AAD9BPQ3_DISEL|nr:3-deoxy-D-manno-octulosonic acid kinase [Dissostichus eleginoides]